MVAMGDTGGRFSTFNAELVLNDEALDPLPDSTLITSGSYRPTRASSGPDGLPTPQDFFSPAPAGPYASTLSYLDGTNPNGTWKLYVLDDTVGAEGAIGGGWSVTIKARVLR